MDRVSPIDPPKIIVWIRIVTRYLLLVAALSGPVTYVVACAWLWLYQENLLLYPLPQLSRKPDDVGLSYQDLSVTTADGVKLHGWSIPPNNNGARWVLYCHGNAGNISHRLDMARLLHHLGFGAVFFDYRGYGQSQGRPHGEKDLVADGQAFLDDLTSRVPADRVIVYGESLGGGVACALAARQPVGGLVLHSTFSSVTALAKESYPWFPIEMLCRYRFDNLEALSRVSCPRAVLHSPTDEINRFHHGQALRRAAGPDCQWGELKGSHSVPDPQSLMVALTNFRNRLGP